MDNIYLENFDFNIFQNESRTPVSGKMHPTWNKIRTIHCKSRRWQIEQYGLWIHHAQYEVREDVVSKTGNLDISGIWRMTKTLFERYNGRSFYLILFSSYCLEISHNMKEGGGAHVCCPTKEAYFQQSSTPIWARMWETGWVVCDGRRVKSMHSQPRKWIWPNIHKSFLVLEDKVYLGSGLFRVCFWENGGK